MQHKTAILTVHPVCTLNKSQGSRVSITGLSITLIKVHVRCTLVGYGYYLAAFQKNTCYYTKTNQIHINRINSPVKISGEFQQN